MMNGKRLLAGLTVCVLTLTGVGAYEAWNEERETVVEAATAITLIGKEQAEVIALEHAGVKKTDAKELEVEIDEEKKTKVYEIEFLSGEYEYDYVIHGETGEILWSEKEYDDDIKAEKTAVKEETKTEKPVAKEETKMEKPVAKEETKTEKPVVKEETKTEKPAVKEEATKTEKEVVKETTTDTGNDIGKEKAKAIALSHAGCAENQTSRMEIEREVDDGRLEYSVEFYVGNMEYEYEIDGEDGSILEYDWDEEEHKK